MIDSRDAVVGFLAVDKPSGPTSHDVVAAVRRASGIKKVGHAGTLDPMATGVVVVALGRATRLIRFIQDMDKEYLATARFGETTDTLDADGEIVARQPMDVTRSDVDGAAAAFVGDIMQVPPMVSALKVDGRRLYELAREGTEIEREARPVVVHELEILDVSPPPFPEVQMLVKCGKGTYIRSLANDIAGSLGGFAHLTALRRTAVGAFHASDAVPVDELGDGWRENLVEPGRGLSHLPAVKVNGDVEVAIRHGRRFPHRLLDSVPEEVPYRIVDGSDQLLAIYSNRRPGSRAEVVIA